MIHQAQSLKDKRRVVASLKDRLHREHQVSVAEVDQLDSIQRAILGITMASNDARHARSVLDRILDGLRQHRDCVLGDFRTEVMGGQ